MMLLILLIGWLVYSHGINAAFADDVIADVDVIADDDAFCSCWMDLMLTACVVA